MTDDVNPNGNAETTETESQATDQATDAATQPTEESAKPAVNWDDFLSAEDLPDDVLDRLTKHPKVSGVIGKHAQRQAQQHAETFRQQYEREKAEEAARAAEQELLQQAESDPIAFANRFLKEKDAERVKRELAELHTNARKELSAQAVKALSQLPEWGDMTPEEYQRVLHERVANKPDDEALGAFVTAYSEWLADKRATRRLEAWKREELEKEREAIRKEELSKLRDGESAPDLARARRFPASDEPDYKANPQAWNDWYERKHRGAVKTNYAQQ